VSARDEERLTAYALGELEGGDLAEAEALVAADPAAREEVEALRATAASLEADLGREVSPGLDPAHRRALEERLVPSRPRLLPRPAWNRGGVAAAALLVVALAVSGRPKPADDGAGSGGVAGEVGAVPIYVIDGPVTGDLSTPFVVNFGQGTASEWYGADMTAVAGSGIQPTSRSAGKEFPALGVGAGGGGAGGNSHYYPTSANWRNGAAGGGGAGGPVVPLLGDRPILGYRFVPEHDVSASWTVGNQSVMEFGVFDVGSGAEAQVIDLPRDRAEGSTASYAHIVENRFLEPRVDPLSTFSIDVDTAGYAILRRSLAAGTLPPPASIRIEEMVNYFRYRYPAPAGDAPFSVQVDAATCPWNPEHRLVRIGLRGREFDEGARPASNLVFLVDVSGSMNQPNKLPLVQAGLRILCGRLGAADRVAMVVYAGAAGLVLPPTPGDRKADILAAIDRLQAGGSTNGAQGIELAYATAEANFLRGGTNRVVLATDGDFNVGVTSEAALVDLIERKRRGGVSLTALGFGYDNLQDSTLEKLADRGNGNYAFIDTEREAARVLGEEATATLHTIAKDVKIQVEFNPTAVAAYRLVGYENRMLAAQDFNDDAKDAGEIGAGHTVTALYEVVPAGKPVPAASVVPLRYQVPATPTDAAGRGELLAVKLRYKEPAGEASRLLEVPFADGGTSFEQASEDFRFAAAAAAFGLVLRDSGYRGTASFDTVKEIAAGTLGSDPGGFRAEFLGLVEKARALAAAAAAAAAPSPAPDAPR